ncbi:MAG: hypothetical protein ACR2NN_11365 [Bryobacteraceae bacterium]
MYSSVRTLLTGLIDYAGLFPPASLDMASAVREFESYRASEFAWALGRFIVPASRLDELEAAMGNGFGPLSVLIGSDRNRDVAQIHAFAQRHPGAIETIEVKAATVENIRNISQGTPSELPTFFEIPVTDSRATLLSAISEEGCCAKIRTGGVQPDAFPSADDLVRFLQLSSILGVPFKATAGLHHPIRGSHKMTYEEHSPCAVMHGFVNVFLAAGFVRNHMPTQLVTELIEEQSPEAFQFGEDGVRWRNNRLSKDEMAAMRNNFGVAFGSCSFEEPIEDLRSMSLL